MTTQIWIEIGKMISPILTVGLAAFLAARYYEKNKRVDFSLKLSEKVLEEVYTPVLVMIEKQQSVVVGDGYEGLALHEVEEIDRLFKKHRHLINPKLASMLWALNEEFVWVSRTTNEEDPNYVLQNHLVDLDRKFLEALEKENEYHLKRIGFYSKDK